MNLTKKTLLALGFAALAASTQAQTATADPAPVGVLGQSFTDLSFGVTDIKGFGKDVYDAGLAANVPVTANLDLGAGYSYSWMRREGHFHNVFGGATAYTTFHGVKPFVGAALGYQWDRWSRNRDDQATWGGTAGVEIPVGTFSLSPRLSYADDFHGTDRSTQQWTYSVEANHWLTRTAAVYADVGYVDVKGPGSEAWQYTIGARLKF